MIHYVEGDIFESEAHVLVCPVNCLGTMGKGLARQFRDWYPTVDREYQKALRDGTLHINQVKLVRARNIETRKERDICLFPTKWDWREPSRVQWIDLGLESLKTELWPKESVALPKIGCGLGGLNFEKQVKPLIEYYMDDHDGEVFVYV